MCIIIRTINHAVTSFMLPTAYIAPGQENISDDNDKVKIAINPKTGKASDYTEEQLEDVVRGWMRHIQNTIKTNRTTVGLIFFLRHLAHTCI